MANAMNASNGEIRIAEIKAIAEPCKFEGIKTAGSRHTKAMYLGTSMGLGKMAVHAGR